MFFPIKKVKLTSNDQALILEIRPGIKYSPNAVRIRSKLDAGPKLPKFPESLLWPLEIFYFIACPGFTPYHLRSMAQCWVRKRYPIEWWGCAWAMLMADYLRYSREIAPVKYRMWPWWVPYNNSNLQIEAEYSSNRVWIMFRQKTFVGRYSTSLFVKAEYAVTVPNSVTEMTCRKTLEQFDPLIPRNVLQFVAEDAEDQGLLDSTGEPEKLSRIRTVR